MIKTLYIIIIQSYIVYNKDIKDKLFITRPNWRYKSFFGKKYL